MRQTLGRALESKDAAILQYPVCRSPVANHVERNSLHPHPQPSKTKQNRLKPTMPKVSRVGKFRKTAAAAAAAATAATAAVAAKATNEASKSHHEAPKGKAKVVPVSTTNTTDTTNTTTPKTKEQDKSQLSRGQRKRQAKRDQFLRRQKLVLSTLQLQRQEEQKKRIDGLDALKEALRATEAEPSTTTTKSVTTKTPSTPNNAASDARDNSTPGVSSALDKNKTKKELTAREVTRLGLVLEHPAFQTDPIAALQEHLRNSIAPLPKVPTGTVRGTKASKVIAGSKKSHKATPSRRKSALESISKLQAVKAAAGKSSKKGRKRRVR